MPRAFLPSVVRRVLCCVALAVSVPGCGDDLPAFECDSARLTSRNVLECEAEFTAQAARPLDASLPGATTVKTILDRSANNAVYFQDTQAFPFHSAFAIAHLGWPAGTPFLEQYLSPTRRFVLGSVTYYEQPQVWAYELAAYDNASVELITLAFDQVAQATYFGAELVFHPTSEEQAARAAALPGRIPVVTTDELFANTTYQPLNPGETYARVHLLTAAELETTYVSPRELVVLDRVPNDLSVVAGVVTAAFQTPLSHVNVLSQQRGTPNMALRDAQTAFAPYDGKWVRLTVGAFAWSVTEVTAAEADAWFEAHRPPPAELPAPDWTITAIASVDDLSHADVPAYGGKATGYAELRKIGPPVNVRPALALPLSYYRAFMQAHGFDLRVQAMLADPDFNNDGNARRDQLAALRADMIAAPLDATVLATIEARLELDFPGTRMKFRSSTNAEDLGQHTGAGLYESVSGQVGDPAKPVDVALKSVWASLWNLRAFEERAYVSIDHTEVGMGMLINPSFTDEVANGVAITANIYDTTVGGEDAFYVNAQVGETSVVQPDPGVVADSFLYYYFHNGQPATYFTRSNQTENDANVLTRAETFKLGQALEAIRDHFDDIYDPPSGYPVLPMDVEWKLSPGPTGTEIWIKQARPFPGRGE